MAPAQQLDGDLAIELLVERDIDHTHAPGPDLAHDREAADLARLDRLAEQRGGHEVLVVAGLEPVPGVIEGRGEPGLQAVASVVVVLGPLGGGRRLWIAIVR